MRFQIADFRLQIQSQISDFRFHRTSQTQNRGCNASNQQSEMESAICNLRSAISKREPYLASANTQIVPPSGTSGYLPGKIAFSRPCIERESMPHPDCTATYCRPSMAKVDGWPMMPDEVANS